MNTNPPTDSELEAELEALKADAYRFDQLADSLQWVLIGLAVGCILFGVALS